MRKLFRLLSWLRTHATGAARVHAMLLTLWTAVASPAAALTFDVSQGQESLSKGLPSWRESNVSLRGAWSASLDVGANVHSASRFNTTNREAGVNAAWRPAPGWALDALVTGSSSATFLPKASVGANATRDLGDGWVVGGGVLRRVYAVTGVTTINATIDKYFGPWRVAATGQHARSGLGVVGGAARVQVDHDFGDRRLLSFTAGGGRELDLAAASVPVYNITALAVRGTWPLSQVAVLQVGLTTHQQGSAYRRTGASVGLQFVH